MPAKDTGAVIARLRSFASISEEAAEGIAKMPMRTGTFKARATIVHQGQRSVQVCVILDGFAAMNKVLSNGERQITAFHLRGDIPDLHGLHLEVLDTGIQALSDCRVGFIQHAAVRNLCLRFPAVASALWKMTLVDAAIYREWIATIGQRDAYSRLAHMVCEIVLRLKAIGESDGVTCAWPITQIDLADAAGISPVHVNRIIQELRNHDLIDLDRKTLRILNWTALCEAGGFNPLYLHLGESAV